MAINVFPAASSSSASTLANTFIATSPNVMYSASLSNAGAGTYTVTCATSTVATVSFWNASTLLTTAVTATGTVSVSLASAPTTVSYFTNTGSSIVISAQLTGNALSYSASGTLEVLTTSQTYSRTGNAYVAVIGAGGSGGSGWYYVGTGGGGGGSGALSSGIAKLTGSVAVTIGAGGVSVSQAGGNSGGQTSFGSITGNGGGGGGAAGYTNYQYGGGGGGGSPRGGNGGTGNQNNAQTSQAPEYSFVTPLTTSGGGGSGYGPAAYTMPGSIGLGGNGASGQNGSGTGANGAVYVLYF